MGAIETPTLHGWARGLNTSLRPDEIADECTPRALNTDLSYIGLAGENVMASKRQGFLTVNITPMTSSPAVVTQKEYNIVTGSSNTRYHVLVGSNKQLWKRNDDNTVSVADATATTPFTAVTGQNYVEAEQANNLLFFANGLDLKKFNGTLVQPFGIVRPAVVPTIADNGAAGLHSGTYEGSYTYYNSATGVESSLSGNSTLLTITNKKIDWTWTVPGDTQVDKVRLYLRNTGTMANPFQVVELAIGTSQPYTSNALDANLLIPAPTQSENNPPPTTIKHLAWHKSRMFAADDNYLYYSKIGMPEQFDPNNYERVSSQDGQRITAIYSTQEVLVILKRQSLHLLSGDDPNSWSLVRIDPTTGCASARSVVGVEGTLYWWSDIGPVMWDGAGVPKPIGIPLIAATISPTEIDQSALLNITGTVDVHNQHVMWACPPPSSQRNTFILPFNYRLQAWEGIWNPIDTASLAVIKDANDVPWIYLGGYAGQVFKWWASVNDGMRDVNNAGTTLQKSGTVTIPGNQTTINSIGGATQLDHDGSGLVERYAELYDLDTGDSHGRQRIISNDNTSFVTANNFTNLTGGATYGWRIGAVDWQFDTKWIAGASPFYKKRFTYAFLEMEGSTGMSVYVDFFRNLNLADHQTRLLSPTFNSSESGTVAVWDSSLWDLSAFETSVPARVRFRIGLTGRYWMIRLRNASHDDTLTLTKVGVEQELLTSRS